MSEGGQLLAEYAGTGSEEAFREVVARYLGLVYSTALRLVHGDAHCAEDVTQRVFADLAKMAGSLSKDVLLGGWLHRHTCFIASKTMRTERRRQAREQQAAIMNDLNQPSPAEQAALAPVLDEAINQLGAADRQAILLRFFEQRDFQSVGGALGSSEEAARKRVNRALDKLRGLLKRRGVSLSAGALGAALSSPSLAAAPAGLVLGVTSGALAVAASGGGTTLAVLHFMSMKKFQGGVIAAITLALTVPLVLQHRTSTQLREENQALRAELRQAEDLTAENQRLSNLLASVRTPAAPARDDSAREILKLRGEVGALRKTADDVAAKASEAPLSAVTADPEMHKAIRDQQKMGFGMIYRGFAQRSKLPAEKMDELNSLLADHVMANLGHITKVLRDGASPAEMDQIFGRQELAVKAQVKELLGDEAFGMFEEYNRDLASYLTAEQFKGTLPGDQEAKEAAGKKLRELMREETRKALAARGLSEDYQTVPSLNFRNFASEEEGERNLMLLDSIYEQVQARAGSFLSPEEVRKFSEFRKAAIDNNRAALAINRKLMAPALKQP